jgi:two-component system sensor histidine kinase KdpD
MSQLLDNLIDNALKYSPGDAPIELLVRRQTAPMLGRQGAAANLNGTPSVPDVPHPSDRPVAGAVSAQLDHLVLAVRDRGPGIAPAWRERVFEVFHRGADPMAASGGAAETMHADALRRSGSGVGLAVCRAIARAHGGELTLRARGHGGCSFEAVLPLREAPARPADHDSEAAAPSAALAPTPSFASGLP